uniref:Large ribosomal subunit protein uL10m n=1 Tax=Gallus gallus TaxID=9031 RepID=A0A8V0ZP71_CHICK
MAALSGPAPWRGGWLPALQLVRRGSKAVTRHWKAMHFQRQKLMAVTEYIAPRPAVPERCLAPRRKVEEEEEEYGYARLLRQQVEEAFRDNRMIAVCQYNSMPGEDMVLMRHYLRKHNIEVKFVLNEIVRPVLSQSRYKNLLPLFVSRNILLVSPETKAKEMLRVLKGVPQVNLLGACIDDTILSRQGVENFAKLPSLETSRGQTLGLARQGAQQGQSLPRAQGHSDTHSQPPVGLLHQLCLRAGIEGSAMREQPALGLSTAQPCSTAGPAHPFALLPAPVAHGVGPAVLWVLWDVLREALVLSGGGRDLWQRWHGGLPTFRATGVACRTVLQLSLSDGHGAERAAPLAVPLKLAAWW